MNILLENLLKILFGKNLVGEHSFADFNRVYFSNRNPEIKTNEDMLDYILNFVGYYNLCIPLAKLKDFGVIDFLQKKQADGSLLSTRDLNKMYGINNSRKLLELVERGVVTYYNPDDKYNWYTYVDNSYRQSMFLQAKYKPLFYQALLRDRLNTKIYKMTDIHPRKNESNIRFRTTNDFKRYILDCCILNRFVIYERPESTDFINYLDKLHQEGRLLGGVDIERHFGLSGSKIILGDNFGQKLLNQYWVSGANKSIGFIRDGAAYSYLPIENIDDFTRWVKSADNTIFCLTDKDLALKTFFKETKLLTPENIAAFERVRPAPPKKDIFQIIDYCIDYASFYVVPLQDFRISPYSLSKVLNEKRQQGELLTAADIERVTGINKYIPSLLNSFGKTYPYSTLRFVEDYGSSQTYLRANMLDSFIAGAKQYQFITSFAKLPDLFNGVLRQEKKKRTESLSMQYIDGKLMDVVDLESAFPGCAINMKRALREFDSLCPNTVVNGRYLPADKVADFQRIMRIEPTKKQVVQENNDVYLLTDKQMDAVATALAQKNYTSERNAVYELFEHLERGYFHKQK